MWDSIMLMHLPAKRIMTI